MKESKYISSKKKSRKDRNCDIAWLKGNKKHLCGISTNSQKNAGITLVALVITVIVLIILAGVTLSTLVGDEGIISKAQEAKQNMEIASKEEDALIQNLLNEIKGAGEVGEGEVEIPEETLAIGEIEWNNGQAQVSIMAKLEEGESLQYRINAEGSWTEIAAGNPVTGLHHGDTVYARIWDGSTAVMERSKEIKDEIAPKVSITVGEVTENSIQVTVTVEEKESGLPSTETYEYCIGEAEAIDGKSTENEYVYQTDLQPETSYKLTVKVTDLAGNEGKASTTATTIEKTGISTTESYVGYYADVTGDGTVDGVIYADLAIGGSGAWVNTNGSYTIGTQTNLKDYYIIQESYSGPFGTHPVVAPKGNTAGKNDRFYVMALSDIDGSMHYFYKNGSMTVETSTNFGTGKQNTATMMDRWNNAKYGSKDNNDLWGFIKTQVQQGWFVPSRGEWGAFLNELGITGGSGGNYSSFGLSGNYWSSSQLSSIYTWSANLGMGSINYGTMGGTFYVRLSTTF